MSASSVSTTASSSFSRYSATTSAMSAGMSTGSPSLPPSGLVYAHMCSTSTMPVSSCSTPIGRCTATHCVESCVRSPSSVRKKSARSRSSMFTMTTRARPSSSASFHARDVPTSTPMTAETVTSIPSTTRAAVRSSPWKRGVARDVDEVELALLPAHVLERHRDRELARVLVLVGVRDRRPRLHRAEAVDARRTGRGAPRRATSFPSRGGRRRRRCGSWQARAWAGSPPRARVPAGSLGSGFSLTSSSGSTPRAWRSG